MLPCSRLYLCLNLHRILYAIQYILYGNMLLNISMSSRGVIQFRYLAGNTLIERMSQMFDFIHINYFL